MKASVVSSVLLSSLSLVAAAPSTKAHSKRAGAGAFYLAGDSTTAGGDNAGGWGDGFLGTLVEGSIGTNYGHSGATTVSFVDGGDWASVIESVMGSAADYDTYVTIQFGHNDQKEEAGISMEEFQANLEQMAADVVAAGGIPILATSLSRRNYDDNNEISMDLENVVEAAKAASASSNTSYIDLNAASVAYLNAIGPDNAYTYNLASDDNTHLNTAGNVLFGNMVSWLLTTADTLSGEQKALFQAYTAPQEDIAAAIEAGEYILPE